MSHIQSDEYNLKFHEAIAAAVNDDVVIETREHKYRFKWNGRSLEYFQSDTATGDVGEDLSWFYLHSWRVIRKKLKFAFEAKVVSATMDHPSRKSAINFERDLSLQFSKFIGKNVRVKIEEVQE